jgi:hypothetical protein
MAMTRCSRGRVAAIKKNREQREGSRGLREDRVGRRGERWGTGVGCELTEERGRDRSAASRRPLWEHNLEPPLPPPDGRALGGEPQGGGGGMKLCPVAGRSMWLLVRGTGAVRWAAV